MNEIEALRQMRLELSRPAEGEIERARDRLRTAIAGEVSGGQARGSWLRKRRAQVFLGLALAIGIPSGLAVAGVFEEVPSDRIAEGPPSSDEISPGGAVGPEACPEVTAAMEAAGVRPFTAYPAGTRCPNQHEVDKNIRFQLKDRMLRAEALADRVTERAERIADDLAPK